MKRRSRLRSMLSVPLLAGLLERRAGRSDQRRRRGRPLHVAVVGAGAFGGWTALHLLRAGARVTLWEAIEAGNPLASSGGESRVIRHAYRQRIYVDMAAHALELWQEASRRWQRPLFIQRGVLFMGQDTDFLDDARRHMQAAGVAHEMLEPVQLAKRHAGFNPEGIGWALYEPEAGYLAARLACEAVRDAFVAEGGEYRLGRVRPGRVVGGELAGLELPAGDRLQADQYVFACGPWLRQLFPELLAAHLKVTRQEVYFFRGSGAKVDALARGFPVWAEVGERFWYGIPAADGLFKIADDSRGPEVDPSTQSREATPAGIAAARQFLGYRFPALGTAHHVDSRVCQYTETPDGHFIADRHPGAGNAWLLGGGSGHGFKHGPALGERMAEQVLGQRAVEPQFGLARPGLGAGG